MLCSIVAVGAALLLPPAPVLVFGPGSNELRLLAAKLASRAGYEAAVYSPDARTARSWRRLLYGVAEDADVDGRARVLVGTDELGVTLQSAEVLCLVCDSAPLPNGSTEVLLKNAPQLKRCVLLSKMGVTRARPAGPFGVGGEGATLLENERSIRAALDARGVELSIVRVGVLKGGGPGGEQGAFREGDAELGLSRPYIDSIAELETYLTTQSYDRFTLGAKCMAGDPVDLPNVFMCAAQRGSFEPRDHETSRTVAAAAAVHAIRHPSTVEVTVGAAKADALPTIDEWATMFDML